MVCGLCGQLKERVGCVLVLYISVVPITVVVLYISGLWAVWATQRIGGVCSSLIH